MKTLIKILAAGSLLLCGATLALAQSDSATSRESLLAKISYPISDLGNCDSRDACKLYCDVAENRDACFAYAQKTGLMTKEKVNAAKLVLSKKGPGSCGSREECLTYCSDSSHQDECLAFAQSHNVLGRDRTEVVSGDPVRGITAAAMASDRTLVVVGMRGADEAPVGSVGSVARELLSRAPMPVLVVSGL